MKSGRRGEVQNLYESEELGVCTAEALVRDRLEHFEWVARPEIVVAVAYIPDGRLVLVRQYRSAIDDYTLECPAGKVGDGVSGESPSEALERELEEEAGYKLATARHLGALLSAPHFSDETIHVYVTRGAIVAEPLPTSHEQLTVELVAPQDLDGLIRSGALCDAKSLAALLLHRQQDDSH